MRIDDTEVTLLDLFNYSVLVMLMLSYPLGIVLVFPTFNEYDIIDCQRWFQRQCSNAMKKTRLPLHFA